GLLLLSSLAVFAADPAKKKEPTAEEKAAMDAMMKAASPGEQHKKLESLVGTWNATMKMYMQPGAPAQESHGTAVDEAILGGRFVQEKFNGQFMGMPFNGIGYFGYDNMKKQYVASWIDNMGTSLMTLTGTSDSPNEFTFKGSAPDPMT